MANSKITDLTELTNPASTDMVYVVGSPAATPVDRKVKIGNLGPQIKRARIRGQGSITTTSTSFVTIDATKLPYLYVTLAVGDLVEMTLSAHVFSGGSDNCEFDFEVDYPVSTDGRVNADAGNGLGLDLFRGDRTIAYYRTTMIATEAGSHGFRPVWKTRAGSTLTMANATSDPNDSVIERTVTRWPAGSVL